MFLAIQFLNPFCGQSRPIQCLSSVTQLNDANSLSDLFFTVNNLTAQGAVTDEGFVLKEGSLLSKTNSVSIPGQLASTKDRLLKEGSLKECKDNLITTKDILFSSSSSAAAIVAGTSRSGPQSWKTASGKTIKQIEDAALLEAQS